ncbi:MAG: hypothetical protein A2X48_05615 [Lentisphaerae bacterium GWF2_49_21]|nr:MAG: hypothetical protein A2X48_05615 [Lentisphaerae bacterium GWF2_49_21]
MNNNHLGLYEWDKLDCQLFWIYDNIVPAVGSGRKGIASRYSAWLIKEGGIEFGLSEDSMSKLGKGSWVFPPLGKKKDQIFSPGTRILSMNFLAEWPDGRPFLACDRFVDFSSKKYPGLQKCAESLLATAEKQLSIPVRKNQESLEIDFMTFTSIKEKFWKWLGEWASAMESEGFRYSTPSPVDGRVQSIMKILDGMSFTGEIPYDYLERTVSLGKVQIDRLFMRELGTTPRKYLERRLVSSARALLQGTTLSVKEISAKLGFSSDSHFCAWYKRKTGAYPLSSREEAHG